jgi:hypothetical protein
VLYFTKCPGSALTIFLVLNAVSRIVAVELVILSIHADLEEQRYRALQAWRLDVGTC